jgi:hypothetical protein
VAAVEGAPAGVVHLAGTEPVDAAGCQALHRRVFLDARAVAARFGASGGVFVTVQDTSGDFGLGGAGEGWGAGLTGLVKTAAIEWPAASVKAIDVARAGRSAAQVADAVVAELIAGGPEREVGLDADGGRWTLQAVPVALSGSGARLSASDVVLASGGARGVTAASLIALARTSGAKFVLLGRTPLAEEPASCKGIDDPAALKKVLLTEAMARGEKPAPAALGKAVDGILAGREVRATLAAIEVAGGRARYAPVDVTDGPGLERLLGEVRKAWGPVTVLVHGAGVLADKKIADKTPEMFDRVFSTKIDGLRALLAATASDPLKAVAMFSSVAARTGNNGQCDYAMANEVLNRVGASLAAHRGALVKSFGWGPWEAGMVTPALKAHFASMGVAMIPLDAGAALFAAELQHGPADERELVIGGSADASALLGESGPPSVVAGVHVDARSTPELDGHRVKGEVVVPVVFAIEWMMRAARAVRPDLVLTEVRDVAVHKGILVPAWSTSGLDLVVKARQLDNGRGATVEAEILGVDGRRHYGAVIRFEDAAGVAEPAPRSPDVEPFGDRRVYDGAVVFHGPSFQVVDGLAGVSPAGLVATVSGLAARGWRQDAWQGDPAALDGLLQLGLVWFERVAAGGSLPMRIERVRVHDAGPLDGRLCAVLRARDVKRDEASYDAWLIGEDGRVKAELRGVTHVRLPGSAPARSWSASADA